MIVAVIRLQQNAMKHSNIQPEDEHDHEREYLSRIEALEIAREESIRDLQETPDQITYIAFHKPFNDFCRVRIEFTNEDRGEYVLQLLPPAERLESEKVDDNKIKMVAKNGFVLNAVRTYRNQHSVGLADAKSAVEKMIAEP